MNLNTLFKKQQHLDEHIVKEKDLRGQDLLNYKLTALSVELGECLNEFPKIFKFWSNKDNNRENGIEEFVDCVHFAISIANDLGYTSHEYIKTSPKDLNNLYIGLQNVLATLSVSRKERHVQSLLNNLISLGYQLGFTEDDVLNAYEDKNKENHRRQETNY